MSLMITKGVASARPNHSLLTSTPKSADSLLQWTFKSISNLSLFSFAGGNTATTAHSLLLSGWLNDMDEIRIVVQYDGEWIHKGGKIIYEGGKAKGIVLSKNSSYKELHESVCRALDIKPSEISMTMKFKYISSCETVPPIEVVNDSDVKFFFNEVSDVSTRTPLCITVERKFDSTPVLAIGDEDCAKHDEVKTGLESMESRIQPTMPNEDAIRPDNFPKGIFDHIGSEPAHVLTSPSVTSTRGGAPSPSFVFGLTAASYPFPFSSQQNLASPQNPSLFQASNSLDFNAGAAGGSFSLGSGGRDKTHRRIVIVSKGKQRRK